MNLTPDLAICISYYNDSSFLAESIESVLAQTYTDFELILLNHASTDTSRQIARSYTDERIKHIDRDYNLGAGSGLLLQYFLDAAQGKYIKFFCADDVMLPNCLEELVNYLETHEECAFCFSNTLLIDKNSIIKIKKWHEIYLYYNPNNTSIDTLRNQFKRIGHLPLPACLVRREYLNPAYMEKTFIMSFDMSLWANILVDGGQIGFIDKELIKYREHDGQMSNIQNVHSSISVKFETLRYMDIFYRIKDIRMLQELFSDCPYAKSLSQSEVDLFPFVIAYHNLQSEIYEIQLNGYNKLYDLLNDAAMRCKIEEKFNFTIRDFRNLYTKANRLQRLQHWIFVKYVKLAQILCSVNLVRILGRKLIGFLTKKN